MAEGLLGGIIGSAGGILGGLLGAGKKPVIPAFKPIDFAAEQKQAIKQNLGSLSSASELARKTTTADQSVLEEQLRRAIPGYDQLIAQAGSNIGASLRGEISPEISSQVQRSTAGRALSGGFGGASGMGRSLTARDLRHVHHAGTTRRGFAAAAASSIQSGFASCTGVCCSKSDDVCSWWISLNYWWSCCWSCVQSILWTRKWAGRTRWPIFSVQLRECR